MRGRPPACELDAFASDPFLETVHKDGAGLREHVRLIHAQLAPSQGQRAQGGFFLLPGRVEGVGVGALGPLLIVHLVATQGGGRGHGVRGGLMTARRGRPELLPVSSRRRLVTQFSTAAAASKPV